LIAAPAMAAALASAPPADRAADIAALTEAKLMDWPRYYRENDADGLDAFLADGFVAFDSDGTVETKAQAVDWVRNNKWQNADNRFRYDIAEISFHSDDVANVYGVGSFDGTGPSGRCRMRYTSSNIFVRQSGRWRPAFSHTSDAVCAAAAAPKGD